jgi:hypothetical protein
MERNMRHGTFNDSGNYRNYSRDWSIQAYPISLDRGNNTHPYPIYNKSRGSGDRFTDARVFTNEREKQMNLYRDDIIDNLHVFRREKYKERFLAESFGNQSPMDSKHLSQNILNAITDRIQRGAVYGLTGSRDAKEIPVKVGYGHSDPMMYSRHIELKNPQYNYANRRFDPVKVGIQSGVNGFMKATRSHQIDII